MKRKIDNRLERQIVRLLDGQLGPVQRADLEKRLIREPEANALLQEYEHQDRELREALTAAWNPSVRTDAAELVAPDADVPARAMLGRRAWWAGAAAAIVLLGAGAWLAWRNAGPQAATEPPPPLVATPPREDTSAVDPSAADVVLPGAPATPGRRVRRVDRFYIDVFDDETREFRRFHIDREQIRNEPTYVGL